VLTLAAIRREGEARDAGGRDRAAAHGRLSRRLRGRNRPRSRLRAVDALVRRTGTQPRARATTRRSCCSRRAPKARRRASS
jgi:hypothetical protein